MSVVGPRAEAIPFSNQEDEDSYCVVENPFPCYGRPDTGGDTYFGKISTNGNHELANEQFEREKELRKKLTDVCNENGLDVDDFFVFADCACGLSDEHIQTLLAGKICSFVSGRSTQLLVPKKGQSLKILREEEHEFSERCIADSVLVAVLLLLKVGYQHGDLADRNIVVDDSGLARLIDFHTTTEVERNALDESLTAIRSIFPEHTDRINRKGKSLPLAIQAYRNSCARLKR